MMRARGAVVRATIVCLCLLTGVVSGAETKIRVRSLNFTGLRHVKAGQVRAALATRV